MYLRLLGYPANKISILTTYNGQKLLIRDVISRRCAPYDFIGPPSKVTTVDKFQGQQNDFILLSLVRTRFVGHLRDVRRLIVAMSRARLGLYVFCRRSLFEQCYELQPTFQRLLQRPDHLALNLTESMSFTDRHVEDTGPIYLVSGVEEMANIVNAKMHQVYQARMINQQYNQGYMGQIDTSTDGSVQQSEQDLTSVNDMDTERSDLQNGEAGDALPVSNSEETTDAKEVKNDQNGDVKQNTHMEEDKPESNVPVDGDVAPAATNMEE